MSEGIPTPPNGSAGASQGAGKADLSEGQGTGGAPVLPKIDTQKPTIPQEAREEVHGSPNEDPAKKAAAEAAAKKAADEKAAAEAAKKAEDEKKANSDWHKDYVQFDNPSAQAAVDLLKEAGVSPIEANAAFEKALQTHDLNDINWAMLEAKLGPTKTLLVKSGVEKYYNEVYSVQRATETKVYEIYGSQENWTKVRDWAQKLEKTDPAFKSKLDGVRKALDIGGYTAELAARDLLAQYNKAPGTTGLNTNNIQTGNLNVQNDAGTPLSRAEYNKLQKEAWEKNDYAEMRRLDARRKAGMAQGI